MQTSFIQDSIKLISEENMNISSNDKEIIVNLITKNSPKCSKDAIKLIVAYFTEDLDYLHTTCGHSFGDLKKKIKFLTFGNEVLEKQRDTTNAKMKLYQDPRIKFIAHDELAKCGLDRKNSQAVRIIHEVSPAPKNREEMVANLRLALNHPKYILSESLAVFDCSIGQLPPKWSKIAVFNKLKKQVALELEIKNSKAEDLALLKQTLSLYKNITIAPLSIIVHLDDKPENGAMKINLVLSLLGKLPTLTTKQLFYEALRNQSLCKNLENTLLQGKYTVYVQKQGDLVMILPPSHSLTDEGINLDEFKKVEKSLIQEFAKQPGKGTFDLSSVFLKETEDQRFSRPIAWFGHGASSISKKEAGHIAGLSIPNFQANWDILAKNGLEFLFLSSCFIGGENMSHVTSSIGNVTCPVIIKSSSDISSASSFNMTPHLALQFAALKLYPGGGLNHEPQQLRQKDLREIGSLVMGKDSPNENAQLMNMQSFILPSYNPDIPHAAYSGFISLQAMDVDKELKQQKKNHIIENEVIVDRSEDRQFYFFSQSVAPVTLSNESIQTGRVGLASRGGNNFHIMNGLELPNIELSAIIQKTLANRAHHETEEISTKGSGANKLFAMGKLRCQVNNKNVCLENVIIAATDQGPFIACKAPYDRYYVIDTSEDLNSLNFRAISEDEFCQLFYPVALACSPNLEQLKINAAGRQEAKDFFEKLQKLFWNEKLTLSAELYEAIIHKGYDLEVVHQKSKIFETCKNKEKRRQIILNGIIVAIKTQNLRALEDLMASNIEIDARDEKGIPLFHHAIQSGNKEIVQFFLKCGANPNMQNSKKITGYELATSNIPILKLLIEGRRLDEWNIPFSLGRVPIDHAIVTSNEPLLNLLIEKKIHILTQLASNFPLLYLPLLMGHQGFLKLLIENGLSVNDSYKGIPLIFYAIKKGNAEIVKLFVENGARLDVRDQENLSPLQRALKENNEEIENIILFGAANLKSTKHRAKLANPKASNKYIFEAKDYMNFIKSIDGKETVAQVSREIENKLFKILVMEHDLSDFNELAESGYTFSQEFYQKIINVILKKPTYFKNSLSLLDYGFELPQQQCNQWILKLIKLGLSDQIKGLRERGHTMQNLSPLQEEILTEIFMDLPRDQLIASLLCATAAGLDVRTLGEISKIKIIMALTGTLKDQPKVLAMFDKLLHLDLRKEKLYV
ncbi:MAG: ankyrin repeat domain-containing protein [Candidatus Protochlamydia sp.]|nr:ankyrin repeat domain-containing protein [Candidatus Protochlamydia sp.]